jgi:hypothetical protein
VTRNDLDDAFMHEHNFDVSLPDFWPEFGPIDWTISNPPFSKAGEILTHALANSRAGVALLVRISFLEPTFTRKDLMIANPPTRMIVLPRHSFTGDGKVDSVSCAWLIWDKAGLPAGEPWISFLRKEKHK